MKAVNTNQWPINNRQNLAILCTKHVTVVRQTLIFLRPHIKRKISGLAGHARLNSSIDLAPVPKAVLSLIDSVFTNIYTAVDIEPKVGSIVRYTIEPKVT